MSFQGEESSPFAEPSGGDISGIDADALMSEIDSSPSREIPMTAPQAEPAQTQTPAQAQAAAELAFNWKGTQIKVPFTDPRVNQWASQGYDYAQRMAEFNAQQAEFKTKAEQLGITEQRYKQLEDYVEKHPDWFKHVNSQWEQIRNQNQGLGQDPNNPVVQKLSAFEEKLSKVDQFIQSKQAEEFAQKRQAEDSRLDGEIKSIREQYANLDWNTPDHDGKTLEFKVLEHANAIGTNNFRAAFRDLQHENLIKLTAEQAKENVVKERQTQTKLGILGKTQTPAKGLTNLTDVKNKSWDDVFNEALSEAGIG